MKAKVKVFAFSRYVPTGGEVDTSMTPQEYRRLLEICDAKFKAYEAAGCETYFNRKDHLWTLYEYETGQFKLPENACDGMIYGGCNCGNCHITISSNEGYHGVPQSHRQQGGEYLGRPAGRHLGLPDGKIQRL
ncbi:MAG: hypothetical protein ACLUP9_12460 [Waltera sp.]|uniref:hypothetical protein n=1 Tax=Waltera sp. TaxID=2815806 RepID=UPI00399680ED